MASTWFNDSGVTVYAVTRNASFTVVYEAEIAAGASWSDGTATNSGANAVAFLTSASTNANGNGTDVEAYLGGSPPRTKSGFSGGTIAYPGSGQYYTIASQSGERNLTDNSARSSTVARTKIGHKLLARYGVRRDAIQSGSIEVGHMNFVASEGDASWGGALADTDLFAIHDTSADVVRGIELIDLKSYLSQSVLDATVFNGSIGVTGSISLTSHLRVKDDKKLYFGNGDDASFEYDEDGTDTLLYAGASMRISDDTKLEFGTGGDASFEYDEDGTDTLLYDGASLRINDDTKLEFGVGGDASFEYDEDGTDTLLYAGASMRISDDTKIEFGTGGDASIEYDEDGDDVLQIAGSNVRIGHGAATQLQFRDSAVHISSDADGYLSAQADTGVNLNIGGTDILEATSAGVNVVGTITGDTSLTLDSTTISTAEIGVLDTAAANEVVFSKAVVYGSAGQLTGSAIAGDTLTVAGTTTLNGNVDIGNATGDTVTVTGQFDSDLIPSTDSARDLGTTAKQWAEAHIDTGYIDAITSTGTISGSAGTFHTVTADKLDVRTLNSVAVTQQTLRVEDIVVHTAISASKAETHNAGLKIGGGLMGDASVSGSAWASILYDSANTALDFNISGTTEIRLQDGVLRPETNNDVDLGTSGAQFKDLYLDGTANVDLLKLPDVTSGKILVADGTSYEEVAISGDITIASNGAVTIAAGAVEHGMLAEDIISGQTALGGASVAQADLLMLDDGPGEVKKVTFSNFEDSIFGNVSGDATVAAGGALTIANDAVENSMLHKSVVLDSTGSHGGLNFRNGVLSVGSHIYHFMSSSSPTIVSSSANTQLVASTIGSGGDGDYNIYAMTGSKGAGCVTASLGFTTASHGGGMPASGSLKVYLNGILLFGALDRGGATRTTAANPIPHTSVDYRWDDKKNIQSVVSGSRILLNPNLALDSDDILTVEYLSGTIQGHHSY